MALNLAFPGSGTLLSSALTAFGNSLALSLVNAAVSGDFDPGSILGDAAFAAATAGAGANAGALASVGAGAGAALGDSSS